MMVPVESYTFGFIGTGVMGSALLAAAAKTIPASKIIASDVSAGKLKAIAAQYGCETTASNSDLALKSDIIFLAVKPASLADTIQGITGNLDSKILVSVAAGVPLATLKTYLGSRTTAALVRIMPNLPATIGEGMIAVAPGNEPGAAHAVRLVRAALDGAGVVEEVDERLMDCVTGISGSGPAYAFVFIEALADAAVLLGMPREQAYVYAAQTLKGAAELALRTGKHPAELKDQVCSPAGTTIEALRVLEQKGFRSAIIEAAIAAAQKSAALGKQ